MVHLSDIQRESTQCSMLALISVMMTFLKGTQTEISAGGIHERPFVVE